MNIKELLDKAFRMDDKSKMERFKELVECCLKEHEKKNEIIMKLDFLVYGDDFSEDMSKLVVSKFINSTTKKTGEHWTMEDTNSVHRQNGLSGFDKNSFYVLMNMFYSDYSGTFTDEEIVKMSIAKVKDVDARDGWLKNYIFYNMK